jgi:AAA family ATP:ADP antiporter
MMRFVERLLNLQGGDLKRAAPLFLYLFLIQGGYGMGKIARDALFLDKFAVTKLPYADIGVAVLVGFVVAGYVRLAKRVPMRSLLVWGQLFFVSNALAFWLLARYAHWPWLYPAVYIWVGIFGVLAPAQVWTLANYLLTTREAKRLFGVVGAGAILGNTFGAAGSNLINGRFGTQALLIGIALFLALSVPLVGLIWGQRREAPETAENGTDGSRSQPARLSESLRLIFSSPYLSAIAGVICIASVVTTVARWQFNAFAKAAYVDTGAFTNFRSMFEFCCGLACLATQLLLTSRVLRRFGIGPALLVAPVVLMLASGGILISGALAAAILLRGSDQVFGHSIDRSAVELLYLPVAPRIKVAVKSIIDTFVWRLGDGLGGLVLLIVATGLGWSMRRVSWVTLALLVCWLVGALVARRGYTAALRESIRQQHLDTQQISLPVLDRATTALIAAHLSTVQGSDMLYALSLFELGRKQASHPALRVLLRHPDPRVRARVASILSEAGDRSVLPHMEKLLRDAQLEVRTAALLYLARHAHVDPLAKIQELGDFPDFSARSAVVVFLAQPGPAQNLAAARALFDQMVHEDPSAGSRARAEATRLIPSLPRDFGDCLDALLADPDPDVARQAIDTAGRLRDRRFVPLLLQRLAAPELNSQAAEALARFGDRIVGTLRDGLVDTRAPLALRREIPAVLARIGTEAAARVLCENLLDADPALRSQVMAALNKICGSRPQTPMDTQLVETVLAAEIMGHYGSYKFLGRLGSALEGDEAAASALKESMARDVERIFLLLKLLYPAHDLRRAYRALQSHDAAVRDNAVEFLDNVLNPSLRRMLVPLFDRQVGVPERVELANRFSGAVLEDREAAIRAMMASEDAWLKCCALYAIQTLRLSSLAPLVRECLNHPDLEVRTAAQQARANLAASVPAAHA